MHQTTVRFGVDLWRALEQEAAREGVSAAQYIRDAALARLAFTQGLEQGRIAESGYQWHEAERGGAASSQAPRSQGRLARNRAKRLRAEADTVSARLHPTLRGASSDE